MHFSAIRSLLLAVYIMLKMQRKPVDANRITIREKLLKLPMGSVYVYDT